MRRWPAVAASKSPLNILLAASACLLLLAACTIRLAPDFDRGILDGLIKANQQTLVHFAAVDSGVSPCTFSEREATYNDFIGKFDAVRIQVLSRPTPRSMIAQLLGIGTSPDSKPEGSNETLEAPTAEILKKIIDTLKKMRDTDGEKGLTPSAVEGFKGSYEISIDQALTYEAALER